MFPKVREAYGYDEEDRWSEDFGVRKQALIMKRSDVERGFYNGYRRKRGRASENPGISPAVLRYLLPYTTFATLSDLGYVLPPYREEAVVLEMDPEQRAQYSAIDDSLRSMVRKQPRFLATWLQTTLGRGRRRKGNAGLGPRRRSGWPGPTALSAEGAVAVRLLPGRSGGWAEGAGLRPPDRRERHPGPVERGTG